MFLFFSCSTEAPKTKRKIASVGKSELYFEEIAPLLSGAVSREDSLFRIKKYIKTWIETELLSRKARKVLKEKTLDSLQEVLLQTEKNLLANTLLLQSYKEEADTNFSEKDFRRIYQTIKENFPAKENLYKYYFVLTSNWKTAQRIKALFHRNETKKVMELVKTQPYIQSYSFDSSWVSEDSLKAFFNELRTTLPMLEAREIPYVTWAVYKRQRSILVMKIFEKIKQGEPLPLELVKEDIKPVVISVKQKEFFEKYITRLENENKNQIYIIPLDSIFRFIGTSIR